MDQVELREVPRVDATVAFGSEAQRFEVEEEDWTAAEGVEAELIGEGEQTVHEPPAQEGCGSRGRWSPRGSGPPRATW